MILAKTKEVGLNSVDSGGMQDGAGHERFIPNGVV
jgi:hypothetical protein